MVPPLERFVLLKIISPFVDYYDKVQSLGHDDSVLFIRKPVEISIPKFSTSLTPTETDFNQTFHLSELTGLRGPLQALKILNCTRSQFFTKGTDSGFFLVVLAGKSFFGYRLALPPLRPGAGDAPEFEHFYTMEDIERGRLRLLARRNLSKDGLKTILQRLAGLEVILSEKADRNLFQLKSVDPEALRSRRITQAVIFHYGMQVNTRLADWQFFRQVPAAQAFQAIEQYHTGVLAAPEPEMLTLSEKDQLRRKGFDCWSFKKAPAIPPGTCPKEAHSEKRRENGSRR